MSTLMKDLMIPRDWREEKSLDNVGTAFRTHPPTHIAKHFVGGGGGGVVGEETHTERRMGELIWLCDNFCCDTICRWNQLISSRILYFNLPIPHWDKIIFLCCFCYVHCWYRNVSLARSPGETDNFSSLHFDGPGFETTSFSLFLNLFLSYYLM